MAATNPYYDDPKLYLYTSLTSGSSHIVTATSRLETILRANRIPFKALDIATDEKARQLWGRRAGKDETGRVRKMPGLVQEGFVVGDLTEVEEWNEYGELKEHVKIVKDTAPAKSGPSTPLSKASEASVAAQENKKPTSATISTATKASASTSKSAEVAVPEQSKPPAGAAPTAISMALRQAGQEAAQKAKDNKKKPPVETFDGVREAEPPKEKPTPAALSISETQLVIVAPTLMQSPTSTTWSQIAGSETKIPQHTIENLESLQSPTSTAWKTKGNETSKSTHDGSSVSVAGPEEIKKTEEKYEEEDDDDDDEDDDDEE